MIINNPYDRIKGKVFAGHLQYSTSDVFIYDDYLQNNLPKYEQD